MRSAHTFSGTILILIITVMLHAADRPITHHPDNPRYFLFRGKPTVLVASGEHYCALANTVFDYTTYLNTLQGANLNLTKVFSGQYTEMWCPEWNTLCVPNGKLIVPWARSSTGGFANGGNKFDLNTWDVNYFNRLKDFVTKAGERGIVVEFGLFSTFYECFAGNREWDVTPVKSSNNINNIGIGGQQDFWDVNNKTMMDVEDAMVKKIVTELMPFDNVYYELCNEPYFTGPGEAWHDHIVSVIRSVHTTHLIGWNICNGSQKVSNPRKDVGILNFHYCNPPNAVADNYDTKKLICFGESGARGSSDQAYRTEAWEFVIAGGTEYNGLDWSFYYGGNEDGDANGWDKGAGGGGASLRKQLGILNKFINGFNLPAMAPHKELIKGGAPDPSYVLAQPGVQYAIYLKGGSQANLVLDLPAGTYKADWVDTKSGETAKTETVTHTGGNKTLASPSYSEDIALRLMVNISDQTPPKIELVTAVKTPSSVTVKFSEPVDKTGAETIANYSIDKGVTITAAVLSTDGQSVTLTTSQLTGNTTYTLIVQNIRDTAAIPNTIQANSTTTFTIPETGIVFHYSSLRAATTDNFELYDCAGNKVLCGSARLRIPSAHTRLASGAYVGLRRLADGTVQRTSVVMKLPGGK